MKYTGWCQNDCNVQGYRRRAPAGSPSRSEKGDRLSLVHPLSYTLNSTDTKDILNLVVLFGVLFTCDFSEKGVRLAQKIQVDQCIPVGIQR